MKKIYLILIIVIFGNLSAQTEFGVKAGYNLSNMKWVNSGYDNYRFDSYSYFYVGGLVENHLSEKFSIQEEIIYTKLGGKHSEEINAIVGNEVVDMGTNVTRFTTSQIQIPISAKYYLIPNFSLSAGMTLGFNFSSKVSNTFTSDTTPSGKTDLFKTVNLFPFLGTEYKLNNNFFLDARYNFNFFNTAIKNAPKTKIGFLQIGLGYRFK
jgi:hypothetical protein